MHAKLTGSIYDERLAELDHMLASCDMVVRRREWVAKLEADLAEARLALKDARAENAVLYVQYGL